MIVYQFWRESISLQRVRTSPFFENLMKIFKLKNNNVVI